MNDPTVFDSRPDAALGAQLRLQLFVVELEEARQEPQGAHRHVVLAARLKAANRGERVGEAVCFGLCTHVCIVTCKQNSKSTQSCSLAQRYIRRLRISRTILARHKPNTKTLYVPSARR